LVYFRPDNRGEAVEEIALSAIWRKWARTSYDYFRLISLDTLPFHRNRQQVTIAEQLFGFVEQQQGIQSNVSSAHALASRLRFSFGLLHPDQDSCFEDEVLLKVLDSPKPPSPALYFKRRNGKGEYISKSALKPELHTPQAFITVVVLELFREHLISVGKAAELLELSYREFLDLLQAKNIPVITAPPRDPQEVAALLHRAEGSV
jgi:hypothetical protein